VETSGVLELARQGFFVAAMVALPILGVALFLGLVISVFQAVTQVQELTLTYVPKLIGAGLVTVGLAGWMLSVLVSYFRLCFEYAARVVP